MSDQLSRLQQLLDELFQIDQADLDFGIYRVMNQKREEVRRFIERDLLPQVRTALGTYQATERDALQGDLAQLELQLRETAGITDFSTSPTHQELQARLAQIADPAEAEARVFDDLYTFFRRYYKDGDFLSLRRYKAGVYAIPYEGEEVKLHWANADQYYVKTMESFRDYRFTLPDGRTVHFRLTLAGTEADNNKAQEGKERRFVLREDAPVEEVVGELHVSFEYRPHPESRKSLNAAAAAAILAHPAAAPWRDALYTAAPTKSNGARTLLEKRLDDYTAKNTFDYFIHKDLGGFLRRELDFYLKSEVLRIDDLDTEDERQVGQYLARLKAIKQIGRKLIAFLAQLEDFQKKLFLKRKFVVSAEYCLTLDRVPEELLGEVLSNERQLAEWERLFAISALLGADSPDEAWLRANPYLVLDTACFGPEFKQRLLASIEDLDSQTDGLLINADNFQALNLLQARYREQVKCIYIDPPYNTGDDGFLYKDNYPTASLS